MGIRSKIIIFIFTSSFLFYKYSQKQVIKRPSELLQIVVQDTEYFTDTMDRVLEFLQQTTKFDELIKHHVKPGVDKLASLRAQTIKYEEMMSRSSTSAGGGPTQFMTSSLESLNVIFENLLEWEKQYRLAIYRINKKWPVLSNEVDNVQRKIKFLRSDELFKPLNAFQIHFQPMDYIDDEMAMTVKQAKNKPLPIQTILQVIRTELIPAIKQVEEHKIKKGQSPIFDGAKDFHQTTDIELVTMLGNLIPHIKQYCGHYNSLGEYWEKTLNDLKQFSNNALEKSEKCKTMYEDLTMGIDTDVTKLKERIKNLNAPRTNTEL